VTPLDGQYLVDRWAAFRAQPSKFSAQQNAGGVTPPPGYTNYLGMTSLSAYASVAADYFGINQAIEGFNVADLAWGTASAKPITMSFWARSSLAGLHGGAIRNNGGTRNYVFSYTIASANTWEFQTVTIPGDTAGTWLANNGIGLQAWFDLGSGSDLTGAAGSWGATGFVRPTGSVSVVGTNGATSLVTGVQIEAGSVATPFEIRDYGRELMMSQRYLPSLSSISTTDYFDEGYTSSTTNVFALFEFLVAPRVPPTGLTVSAASHFTVIMSSGTTVVPTSLAFGAASFKTARYSLAGTGFTANLPCQIYFNNASGRILFTGCEL
jgi:hypothetical protein